MTSYSYILTREEDGADVDHDLVVEYSVDASSKGARDSLGVPEEPDDLGGVCIEKVTEGGVDFVLTDDEENRLVESIEDGLSDGDDGDYDDLND